LSKIDTYRMALSQLDDWDDYLLENSGLPGPRGNLELAQAAALEGTLQQFEHFLTFDALRAPTGTAHEFLAFCGVRGLGKMAATGDLRNLARLRQYASDPRWRLREAVAMALQDVGMADFNLLYEEMSSWDPCTWLEKRAIAAALAEPALLKAPGNAEQALKMLDKITASLLAAPDRKDAGFLVLRQGLGYCWSVVVAACPETGKIVMEKWLASPDTDIHWIMRENLRKKRLERMDAAWVHQWQAALNKRN